MPETIATSAAINITADGIAIENAPLIAGERVPVTATDLDLAEGAALTLVLEARAPTFQIANVALVEDAETGVWSGMLETATRQAAVLFATAGADESRPVVLELIDTANRDSLAILPAALRNSALIPAATPCAVGPVYLPVPGPQGEQGPSGDPRTPSDAPPAMDGAASAGSSGAYARGDHRHPVDTSRASVADATLNGRFSEWTILRDGVDVTLQIQARPTFVGSDLWNISSVHIQTDQQGAEYATGDENAQELTWLAASGDNVANYTATRTALPGYVLGSQTEKPIPKLSDVPAVVAPSTSASDAGKAADAKATGDALAGKLGTGGGTINGDLTVSQSGPSSGGNIGAAAVSAGALTVQGTATISTLNLNGGGLQINGTAFPAETWEFTLSDDSTVQKQILVAPVAAQGGA